MAAYSHASILVLLKRILFVCVIWSVATSGQSTGPSTESTETSIPPVPATTSVSCPSSCHCDFETRTVTCQASSFTSIPGGFPSYTTTLILKNNAFATLPRDSFVGLPNLATLTLTACQIKTIEPGAFNGLQNVRFLHLQLNHLTGLSPGVFEGLPNIRELNLERNQLQIIQEGVFQNMTNLRYLNLNNNPMSQIQDGAFNKLSALSALYLRYGQLISVPAIAMQNMTSLKILALSGNPIPTLPARVFSLLPSLEWLYLDNMELTSIETESFAGLQSLTTIDFAYNRLRNLDSTAFEILPALEMLILTGNSWDCTCHMLQFLKWLQQTSINFYSTSWYCVTPSNLNGHVVYAVEPLAFACTPVITRAPSDTAVTYQERAIFECRANGDPTPSIQWYTPAGSRVTATSNVENMYTVLSGNVLIIQRAEEEDSGIYNCTATNQRGYDSVLFQVLVTDTPSQLTTTMAPTGSTMMTNSISTTPVVANRITCLNFPISTRIDSFTDSSIQVSWSPYNGEEELTGYIVQWHIFGDNNGVNSNFVNGTNAIYTLEDLFPNTGYTVCVALLLKNCPLIIPREQCKDKTTEGEDPVLAATRRKHRNEIIGTALAAILGTLFLMASVFLILWHRRKPKQYSHYDFKGNKDTQAFADIPEDIDGGGFMVGEGGVILTNEVPSGSHTTNNPDNFQDKTYTNLAMDISPDDYENKTYTNLHKTENIYVNMADPLAENVSQDSSTIEHMADIHSDILEPPAEYTGNRGAAYGESDTTDATVSMKSGFSDDFGTKEDKDNTDGDMAHGEPASPDGTLSLNSSPFDDFGTKDDSKPKDDDADHGAVDTKNAATVINGDSGEMEANFSMNSPSVNGDGEEEEVREPKDKPSKVKKSKPSLSSDESMDVNEDGLEMTLMGHHPQSNGDVRPQFGVEIV